MQPLAQLIRPRIGSRFVTGPLPGKQKNVAVNEWDK